MRMREIPFARPMIGDEERNAVGAVLSGSILVHGPVSKEFEKKFGTYVGASHAISVSSCTAAMHLAYFAIGVGAGDEVIVPAQTHTATAHAVELCGAKPVFVDAEARTGNIDIEKIENALTSATKAVSVVHYLGLPVDMDRIVAIAKKHNLFVLEDCALAIGSYFRGIHAGLHGDVGCFSFYPVKHMTTAEGGMFVTGDGDLAARIERVKAFGVDRHMGERTIPGVYDVTRLGFNYRMNEIQSAIGIEQLKRMDRFLKKREQNYKVLAEGLSAVDEIDLFESTGGEYKSSYYCLSILLADKLSKKRFDIVRYLNNHGIGTSVYYPRPVPHMTYYRNKYGYGLDSFPVAARISYRSVALPVGPHLEIEDMQYIVNTLKKAIAEV